MKKDEDHIKDTPPSAKITSWSQNEELFRLLVSSVKDYAIFMLDPEGYIVTWNDGAKKIKGHTEKEIIGKHISVFYTPEDLANNEPSYNLGMAIRLGSFEKEGWRKRKDGSLFLADVVFTALYDKNHDFKGFAKVTRDITQRKKQEDELRHSQEELRKLASYLQNVREEERADMAREIHDELGQLLTVLRFDISHIKSKLGEKDNLIKEMITKSVEQVDNTIKTVRKIASQLRPPTLDEFGLSAALEWQSKEFTGRTGIQCFFNSNDPGTLLKKITATNLFRIYQESLTNVARHSKATTVHASFMLTGNKITLSIEDNGEGFDTEEIKTKNRLGLLGMKERIIIMEGELFIESAPGKGTCLTIQVPFHPIL